MQFAQNESNPGSSGNFDHAVRDLLLKNEEAFDLFLAEAKRKGVRLSLQEPVTYPGAQRFDSMKAQDSRAATKEKGEQTSEAPIMNRAVVQFDNKEVQIESDAKEEILRKLRWNAQESTTSRNLSTLLDRIKEMGIEDPNSFLSLRDAAEKSGVAERTLRRYIADGQLETEKVKGPRGWEHRVYVPALFSVLQEKAGAFERARSSPLEDMGRELATLCRAIVEQQTLTEHRTNRLLDEIRNQSRVIDEMRTENREERKQMYAVQSELVKMLTPAPKKGFFEKLFGGE